MDSSAGQDRERVTRHRIPAPVRTSTVVTSASAPAHEPPCSSRAPADRLALLRTGPVSWTAGIRMLDKKPSMYCLQSRSFLSRRCSLCLPSSASGRRGTSCGAASAGQASLATGHGFDTKLRRVASPGSGRSEKTIIPIVLLDYDQVTMNETSPSRPPWPPPSPRGMRRLRSWAARRRRTVDRWSVPAMVLAVSAVSQGFPLSEDNVRAWLATAQARLRSATRSRARARTPL
jgi:hypothetical protein